jgi:putative cofactor-binding repeat protein
MRMTAETVRFVRTVTGNVVRGFARGPVGARFPAHDNVGDFSLPTVDTVPAS